MKKIAFAAAFVLAGRVACADQVARDQVTLGRLADSVDRIVLAKVLPGAEGRLRLQVEEALKGPATEIDAPLDHEVVCKAGERALFFLAEKDQVLQGPSSPWHRIVVTSDAEAKALVKATRARLPRLGGEVDSLRQELLAELSSNVKRIHEDAALDLLGMRKLVVDAFAREAVASALAMHMESDGRLGVELLLLAARAPSPAVVEPALAAALAAKDSSTIDAAASLLKAIDGAAAKVGPTLAEQLANPSEERAAAAARTLGRLGGENAVTALVRVVDSERAGLRRAAIEGLGKAGASTALAGVAEKPRTIEEGRLALAALTLSGAEDAGKLVAKAARSNPDGRLRRLAHRLTLDPVQTAHHVTLKPEVDPSEKDEIPALEVEKAK